MKLNLSPIIITGIANGPWVPTDSRAISSLLGLSVIITGTATYAIDATMDDPYQSGGPVNTFAPTLTPALAASASTQYTISGQFITALRVRVTASTGSVAVNAWQADTTMGA
jgi:hypothetical protein